jgi:hypothetical protein
VVFSVRNSYSVRLMLFRICSALSADADSINIRKEQGLKGWFVFLWLAWILPILPVLWPWVRIYRVRRVERPRAASLIALTIVTASSVVAAGGLLYLQLTPARRTTWPGPEYAVFAWVFLLSLAGIIAVYVLRRTSPRWLSLLMTTVSLWLGVLAFLGAGTI